MTEKIKKEPEDMAVYKVGEEIPADEILRQHCLSDLNRYREDAGKCTMFEASMRISAVRASSRKSKTTRKYYTIIAQASKGRAFTKGRDKYQRPVMRGRKTLG